MSYTSDGVLGGDGLRFPLGLAVGGEMGIVNTSSSTGAKEVFTMPISLREASNKQQAPDQRFPHEQLDCYRVARELVAWVASHRKQIHGLPGKTASQLESAAVGTLLNIAEAAGRRSPGDRSRVFAIARGEACEAAAALEIAELFGALPAAQVDEARNLLRRTSQMLTRLICRR